MSDPKTPAEWQEVVDLAAGFRVIADCIMYGLIEGAPGIDVERCDELLERGRKRGVHPSRPASELAVLVIAAINGEAKHDAHAL